MEQLIVRGGKSLDGELYLKSAKNAVLPIIACCILSKEEVVIKHCPKISDICSMLDIIKKIGGKAAFIGEDIYINCRDAEASSVESDLTGGIRSSIFILGPILSRFHHASVSYPGGCEIGLRPIDLHLKGLQALNASVNDLGGILVCDGSKMRGGTVILDFPSVGATENIMMAAVLTRGRTVIRNAAREPEICDLQNFINFLGGRVSGAGTGTIEIEGVSSLKGGQYTPISDRIVAGTYMTSCAMLGGKIRLSNTNPLHNSALIEKLLIMGAEIKEFKDSVTVKSTGRIKAVHKIETQPYPGFPTDMQAQVTAALSVANGSSIIAENLFESRFKHTSELNKMGANIVVKNQVAFIKGVKVLKPALLKACDLRGGAALVLAALKADGTSRISDVHHIDRGYYKIEDDFKTLGADISRYKA